MTNPNIFYYISQIYKFLKNYKWQLKHVEYLKVKLGFQRIIQDNKVPVKEKEKKTFVKLNFTKNHFVDILHEYIEYFINILSKIAKKPIN